MVKVSGKKFVLLILLQLVISNVSFAALKADFAVSSISGCSPLTVKYTNSTTGGSSGTTWLWKLGNSNTSTNKDASAIYYISKVYSITLVATDGTKVDSVTKSVTVFGPPAADFKSDKTGGCPPFSVKFTDLSTTGSSAISTWLWDFGDGSTSTSQNPPPHQYVTSSKYSVSLLVTDKNGCQNSVVKKDFVVSSTPPGINFTSPSAGGCTAPVAVNFNSSITSSSGGFIYDWDFGDGNTGTGANPSHTYSAAGSYSVTLKCTDSTGCSGSKTKVDFVFIGKPTADFSYSPDKGCAPLTVYFNDASVGAASGGSYDWDFGDGAHSTNQNPVHAFAIGTYTVKLVVKSASGCTDEVTKQSIISVTKGFTPSFTSDSLLCQLPYTAKFINTSGSGTKVVSWDFGDNSTSTSDNVSHTYPDTGGYYSVTLTVSDGNGCTEQITKPGVINARKTTASIGFGDFEGCAPFDFKFNNNSFSVDPILSTKWDFGDKTTSNVTNPGDHIYSDTGNFMVTLTVVTKKGCKAVATAKVNAGSRPTANFTAYPTVGCLNKLRHVHFTNLTNNGAKIKADKYQWFFGDGESSYDPSPNHRYFSKPGKYDVSLVAYNKGCTDTLKLKKYIVISGPWAKYSTKRDGCVANIVSFFDSSIGANRVKYYFGDGDTSSKRNPVHTYTAGSYRPFQIVYNDTTGCTDTFYLYTPSDPLVIKSPWVVTLTTSTTTGCLPLTIYLTLNNNNDGDNVVYFGNGDSVVVSSVGTPSQVVQYTYTKKGVYQITTKATNPDGCVVKVDVNHVVSANGPNVDFGLDNFKGCVPLKVTLTDLSTKDNTITKKTYDMGNGDILNITSDVMTYTYTKPPPNQYGGFVVTESVTDNTGCTNYISKNVYPSQPVATFTIDSNLTCKEVIYSLIPSDEGLGPFKYAWDLGNGTTSNLRAPVLIYKNGTYTVNLKMTDDNGCVASRAQTVVVHKGKSIADFSVDSTSAKCPPFLVVFHNHSKFAYGGYKGYDWDFGDGSPHSFQAEPQKVFYTPGKFSVSLKITDSLGCSDSITKSGLVEIKGASATYTNDKSRGCVPLTVHFKAISKNASLFEWDMGDGILRDGDTLTYTYTAPRRYTPVLLISDSAGCRYALPPRDTIIVDKLPVPDFRYDSICSGLTTYFRDLTNPGSGVVSNWDWQFGDGGTGIGSQPPHIYKKNGFYMVTLAVTTSFGCTNSTTQKIKIGGISADFASGKTGCVGTPVPFNDKSQSDTAIKGWVWVFGDGDSSTVQNPTHTFLKKGKYDVSLFVSNYKGCVDTIRKGGYLVIGDTVSPPPPDMYRVTVVDDQSVEVDFSKYKDVDFDHYIIYMADAAGTYTPIAKVDNVDDTVYVVNKLATLHNVYCFKVQAFNACGYSSGLSPAHCTMDVTAMPGIEKALVSWTPYIGWPKLAKYKIYRGSFYTPNQYVLIDSVAGDVLNYTDTNVICYRPSTYKIKAVEDSGFHQVSWSDTSTTLPVHQNHVPAPDLLRATVPDNKRTMIEWSDNPPLKIKKWMLEKSLDGINYTPLDTPFNRNVLSVFDKKVDVHNNSYYYRVYMMDSCGDIGPYSNYGKTILLKTDTTPDVKPWLHWSAYKDWPEGVQYYDIEIKDPYGNYKWLARTATGNETDFIDNITDLNSLPDYCYRVVAHRNGPIGAPDQNLGVTSMSNEECMKIVSRVFVPNAFTPNNDGLNDSFAVKGLYIREYHIKIFDRWGTKVFESSSLKDNWNGRFKDGMPFLDSYKYLIYVRGADNSQYFLNGWVTLLP